MATDTHIPFAGNPNTLNRHWSLRKCSPSIHALDTRTMAVFMLLEAYLEMSFEKPDQVLTGTGFYSIWCLSLRPSTIFRF